jgi:hypothetical protein
MGEHRVMDSAEPSGAHHRTRRQVPGLQPLSDEETLNGSYPWRRRLTSILANGGWVLAGLAVLLVISTVAVASLVPRDSRSNGRAYTRSLEMEDPNLQVRATFAVDGDEVRVQTTIFNVGEEAAALDSSCGVFQQMSFSVADDLWGAADRSSGASPLARALIRSVAPPLIEPIAEDARVCPHANDLLVPHVLAPRQELRREAQLDISAANRMSDPTLEASLHYRVADADRSLSGEVELKANASTVKLPPLGPAAEAVAESEIVANWIDRYANEKLPTTIATPSTSGWTVEFFAVKSYLRVSVSPQGEVKRSE